jgi:hypothetical protein
MLSGRRSEPIDIDVGNVFEPPGERNFRRDRTLSKFLDALNEAGRHNPDEIDPIGSYYPPILSLSTEKLNPSAVLKL